MDLLGVFGLIFLLIIYGGLLINKLMIKNIKKEGAETHKLTKETPEADIAESMRKDLIKNFKLAIKELFDLTKYGPYTSLSNEEISFYNYKEFLMRDIRGDLKKLKVNTVNDLEDFLLLKANQFKESLKHKDVDDKRAIIETIALCADLYNKIEHNYKNIKTRKTNISDI